MYWVFSETGHGKQPMDDVGAVIKNICKDTTVYSANAVIWNTDQFLKYLTQNENITTGNYIDVDLKFHKFMFPNSFSIKCKNFGLSKCVEIWWTEIAN